MHAADSQVFETFTAVVVGRQQEAKNAYQKMRLTFDDEEKGCGMVHECWAFSGNASHGAHRLQ